jgi:DNA replication and repair protein RecF
MRIESIELENFRNYEYSRVPQFDVNTNIICGNNAQGKTNLLEALYYLCTVRSYRTRDDSELIRFGQERTTLKAKIVTGEPDGDDYYETENKKRVNEIEIFFGKNERKKVLLNDVRHKTFTSLPFHAVLFSPEDLELGSGGAQLRRKWMDNTISQLRPKYAETLSEFRKIYESKLKILKEYRDNPGMLDALDEFNIQLAKAGAILIHFRAAFCEKLIPIIAASKFTSEKLELKYSTVKTVEEPTKMKPSEICVKLLEHQSEHKEAELSSGTCISGAHKDDVILTLNGNPSEYWSQGQTRTVALMLKLAEREFIKQDTGEYPILLLDDVLSELDSTHRKTVLNEINGGQKFITCCDISDLQRRKIKGKLIPINNGSISITE